MTQSDLAEAVGVRTATISDYERGKSIPAGDTLQRLARALGCSADEIDLKQAVA